MDNLERVNQAWRIKRAAKQLVKSCLPQKIWKPKIQKEHIMQPNIKTATSDLPIQVIAQKPAKNFVVAFGQQKTLFPITPEAESNPSSCYFCPKSNEVRVLIAIQSSLIQGTDSVTFSVPIYHTSSLVIPSILENFRVTSHVLECLNALRSEESDLVSPPFKHLPSLTAVCTDLSTPHEQTVPKAPKFQISSFPINNDHINNTGFNHAHEDVQFIMEKNAVSVEESKAHNEKDKDEAQLIADLFDLSVDEKKSARKISLPRRRSARLMRKSTQQNNCQKEKKQGGKTKQVKLLFDLDNQEEPLNKDQVLNCLQSTGVKIDDAIKEMVDKAKDKDDIERELTINATKEKEQHETVYETDEEGSKTPINYSTPPRFIPGVPGWL